MYWKFKKHLKPVLSTERHSQWFINKKKQEKEGNERLYLAEIISEKTELKLLGFLCLADTFSRVKLQYYC